MKNEQGIMNNKENAGSSLFTVHCSLLKAALEAKDMKEIDRLLEAIEQLPLDAETREGIDVVSDQVLMGEYAGEVEAINTIAAFPKLQFLGKQPWIYGKKRASDCFFKSLPQNQPGFGKGSVCAI
ncbi:MAG: hypothetical protein LBP71_05315 [Spirochaetaceae bacterium]|nr:hypothetical protein [Spirochaetaceae bacterium]